MATIDGTRSTTDDLTIGQYSQGGVVTPRPENQTTNLPDLVHGLEGSIPSTAATATTRSMAGKAGHAERRHRRR
jgi:hypothetical protein